ncbi:beta-sandwich lipoprotein [Castellaniella caeni]|uniref:beta-sandwich lipoprotein n=1 Tax=Castellaniella caeni TaxID=266123 RepID=UPI0021557C8E|nr:hypothetical protein [Castellaniella caeni]
MWFKNLKLCGLAITAGIVATMLAGCQDDAQVASRNLSKAADNFEVTRRIVFYNGITGDYMLSIEGLCSIDTSKTSRTFFVICKTGPDIYKKHFLGLSDNVTFFSEQVEGVAASAYHYRVTFKPQTILPDIDFRGSTKALLNAATPDSRD